MITRRNCPICDRALPEIQAAADRHFPFCSARCRQVDLFRWFEGRYAVVEDIDPELIGELSTETSDFPHPPGSPDR